MTISRSRGRSRSIFCRLWVRAPRILMVSMRQSGVVEVEGRHDNALAVEDSCYLMRSSRLAITVTPVITKPTPSSCTTPRLSSSRSHPSSSVTTGPRLPVNATGPAPSRRIASETIHTGNTVENNAIARASAYTGQGCKNSVSRGRYPEDVAGEIGR